jgi:hypothetical protein
LIVLFLEGDLAGVVDRRAGIVTGEPAGRRQVVGGDRVALPREQALVEVEFPIEFGLEGDLATVVDGGVEAEEVELVGGAGDGGQPLAAPLQDGFDGGTGLAVSGIEPGRERDLAQVVHRGVPADEIKRRSSSTMVVKPPPTSAR